MKRIPGILIATLATSFAHADSPTPQRIFDGRTLSGWEGSERYWHVEDGAITGMISSGETLGENQFIFWKGAVADFDLTLEFRLIGGPEANSGIQYRSQRMSDSRAAGYQADIDNGDSFPIFPLDGIMDQPRELFEWWTPDLKPGEHVVTFSVTDQRGNTAVDKVVFTVKE